MGDYVDRHGDGRVFSPEQVLQAARRREQEARRRERNPSLPPLRIEVRPIHRGRAGRAKDLIRQLDEQTDPVAMTAILDATHPVVRSAAFSRLLQMIRDIGHCPVCGEPLDGKGCRACVEESGSCFDCGFALPAADPRDNYGGPESTALCTCNHEGDS